MFALSTFNLLIQNNSQYYKAVNIHLKQVGICLNRKHSLHINVEHEYESSIFIIIIPRSDNNAVLAVHMCPSII